MKIDMDIPEYEGKPIEIVWGGQLYWHENYSRKRIAELERTLEQCRYNHASHVKRLQSTFDNVVEQRDRLQREVRHLKNVIALVIEQRDRLEDALRDWLTCADTPEEWMRCRFQAKEALASLDEN